MGVLILDHRGTVDPTGTRDGRLEEFDTLACRHCNAALVVRIRGLRKWVDSPARCDRCGPICIACGAALERTRSCPGLHRERVDRAWQGMRARESLFYNMSR